MASNDLFKRFPKKLSKGHGFSIVIALKEQCVLSQSQRVSNSQSYNIAHKPSESSQTLTLRESKDSSQTLRELSNSRRFKRHKQLLTMPERGDGRRLRRSWNRLPYVWKQRSLGPSGPSPNNNLKWLKISKYDWKWLKTTLMTKECLDIRGVYSIFISDDW